MKRLFFCLLTVGLFLMACGSDKANSNTQKQSAAAIDSLEQVAIANTIHDFYKWYVDYSFTPESAIDVLFKVDKKNRVTLNPAGFESYFAKYIATGCLSKKWVDGERARIETASKLWTTTDEQLEGFDMDRIYCAQDGDFPEFVTAPVKAVINGNQAMATMQFKQGSGNGERRKFELEKENGKWMITKFDCEIPTPTQK